MWSLSQTSQVWILVFQLWCKSQRKIIFGFLLIRKWIQSKQHTGLRSGSLSAPGNVSENKHSPAQKQLLQYYFVLSAWIWSTWAKLKLFVPLAFAQTKRMFVREIIQRLCVCVCVCVCVCLCYRCCLWKRLVYCLWVSEGAKVGKNLHNITIC